VIVDDLNIECTSLVKPEAHPKLIVDPDAMLTGTVTNKLLKPIIWRNPQIAQGCCPIQHGELPHRDFFKVHEPCHALASVERGGVLASEGLDHG
jgi:hypothetical protein